MTSEQIEKLNLMCAENGKALPDGSSDAVALMLVQMLGEVALQLAKMNEFEKHFHCIRCYRRIEHFSQKCDRAVAGPCLGMS